MSDRCSTAPADVDREAPRTHTGATVDRRDRPHPMIGAAAVEVSVRPQPVAHSGSVRRTVRTAHAGNVLIHRDLKFPPQVQFKVGE